MQYWKALSSIFVLELVMITEVRPIHLLYLQLVVYQFVLIKTVEK